MPGFLPVVPARGGSLRLPQKNIRLLDGLALIGWTLEVAQAARLPTPVLSTDDPEIAEIGAKLGFRVPFLRPASLATGTAASALVALHALDEMSRIDQIQYDVVMLLQPTSPFRTPSLLKQMCEEKQTSRAPAVVAMRPVHVPLGAIYFGQAGVLVPVAPASNASILEPSGAGYIIDRSSLEQTSSFIPPGTRYITHTGHSALDIDTWDDWLIAEALVTAGHIKRPTQSAVVRMPSLGDS